LGTAKPKPKRRRLLGKKLYRAGRPGYLNNRRAACTGVREEIYKKTKIFLDKHKKP
jgi:hypothetical protein